MACRVITKCDLKLKDIGTSSFIIKIKDYGTERKILELSEEFKLPKERVSIAKYSKKQKQVRANIGLADSLIPSSCDSAKIIYGNDVYS